MFTIFAVQTWHVADCWPPASDLWHPDIMTLWHIVVNRLNMSLTRLSLSSLSLVSQSDLQIIVFKFEIFFLTTPDMSDMSVVNVLMRAGWRWKVLSNCKQSPALPIIQTNNSKLRPPPPPLCTTGILPTPLTILGTDGVCLFYFSLLDFTAHWTSTSVV